MKKIVVVPLLAFALSAISPLNHAAENTAPGRAAGASPGKESRQESTDAVEAIKNYTVEQREEATTKAKAALDALDVRIEALEKRIDKDWDRMDKAAREQARSTLRSLREQRIKAAEWYGGLQNSTTRAWGHAKKGFSDAYRTLKASWEKAEQEYRQKDEAKSQK